MLMIISMLFTYSTIKTLFPNILSSQFSNQLKAVQLKLFLSGIIYILLIVYLSFYISHRIAGPIFRIEEDIKRIVQSDYMDLRFRLREKDELHQLAHLLNELLDYLQKKNETSVQADRHKRE